MLAKDKISTSDRDNTLANIMQFTDLKSGISGTNLVIEAATEDLAVKLNIFKDLDAICDSNTILASNTSSISITQIAAATNRPDKVIGMHFMNPVPIMTLVEIIRGYSTSNTTTKTIMELSEKLGKTPTEVNDLASWGCRCYRNRYRYEIGYGSPYGTITIGRFHRSRCLSFYFKCDA